ncbi:carboxymuconolactone decarboxylase family protein [Paludifilum halophilum]|uniref:3-dehydroquinate dehydratase n=1 Tax=Paludifilum halophilum TaxID=1642702 RepID=A0A235B4Z3_9BACL|nr:carboxymuconolactone decarboxylase family protein [Paludifilum halophilum]OYD07364.1 3-dehydroquinate dehydratase [Paludifilum halophilum]
MEGSMIQEALQEYKEGIGTFERHLPKVARAYRQFTETCFQKGELSVMHKHLIGVALGVMTNDEYCIIFHTKGAVDEGASDQQVLEAASVAGAFGGGVAMSQAVTLLQEALKDFKTTPDKGRKLKH